MTADYMPTTDEVQNAWAEVALSDMSADEADAAFDRWLVEVRREAAEKAWDEGFTRGFYDVLAGGDRDACETSAINPYMKKGDTP